VSFEDNGADQRVPSFVVVKGNETRGVRFAAIPLGHEFTSLVLALLWTGGHPPKVAPEVMAQITALDRDMRLEVYMSLSCHNCPDVVQAATLMAIYNPRIQTTVIDGGLNQAEVEARQVMAVPMVYLNDQVFGSGRMSLEEILGKLDTNAAEREAIKLSEKEPFDVLIVGGGPAGAAAAVYAARKGIRVGVAAERFGGQTNDTMGIENYISVLETDGPKFAAALEAQVRHYKVDIMNLQRAEKIVPAKEVGGLVQVHMANGGVAQCERTGRRAIQKQRRGLLPALRWPIVQGQTCRSDWWWQLRRGGRHRFGRGGGPCHLGRICRCLKGRRRVGEQAQKLGQCEDQGECANHRNFG
jgi:alkyl hydroperoxide reductase subunit F